MRNKKNRFSKRRDDNNKSLPYRYFYHARNEHLDETSIPSVYVGVNDQICQFCDALNFDGERTARGHFNICCSNGKIILPQLNEAPGLIRDLLLGNIKRFNSNNCTNPSEIYNNNIRRFNNAFAFASVGAKFELPTSGYGAHILHLHGQTYHRLSSLHPTNDNEVRKYGQIYILDTDQAIRDRLHLFSTIGTDITPNISEEEKETIKQVPMFLFT